MTRRRPTPKPAARDTGLRLLARQLEARGHVATLSYRELGRLLLAARAIVARRKSPKARGRK